jgi:hypothetical protein
MEEREYVDLERRVQAQEELLTALIASVAMEHPAILPHLEGMFSRRSSAPDEPRPDTLAHAEQVLRTARRMAGAN